MLNVVIDKNMVQIGTRFAVAFYRTLRIPDDGRAYPLPPGLGRISIFDVKDYAAKIPPDWLEEGGAFIPMYQREALWLGFRAAAWKPNAVKITVGGVNVISGKLDHSYTLNEPQDYIVSPEQIWLDGINAGHGTIRQFVAMPLGLGYTVESLVTGTEEFGGIQLTVFEPKPGIFPDKPPPKTTIEHGRLGRPQSAVPVTQQMGIGAGGIMKQKIYPDIHGINVWNQDSSGRITIHILNTSQFRKITGQEPPPTSIDAKTYTEHGLPWFSLYEETKGDVRPPDNFQHVKTVSMRDKELGRDSYFHQSVDVDEAHVRKLGSKPDDD